ncbi:MAG: uncharacterized protein JWN86_3718 [Planctomycetota bacterium]|nr:uncharacterized protein [Planctomycetota bacterium]
MRVYTLLLLVFGGIVAMLIVAIVPRLGVDNEADTDRPPPRLSAPRVEEADGPGEFRPKSILSPFSAVESFRILSATQAGGEIGDDEIVIGVEEVKEARAYPINMMAEPQQEVLNDTIGGKPIAVTWCSRCQNAQVFNRNCDDRVLTLFLPGLIWEGSMVMADRETGSLWSQVLGHAEDGLLKGKDLAVVPSVLMDWKSWKTQHPQTTVVTLPRLSDTYRRRTTDAKPTDPPLILGMTLGNRSKAWPLEEIRRLSPINDRIGDQALLTVFDVKSQAYGVFDRTVDGELLEFENRDGSLVDLKSLSTWDPATGRSLGGPSTGKRLVRSPAYLIRQATWMQFHPKTTVWGDEAGKRP